MSDETDELYLQAREILDAKEREDFLGQACPNNPGLLARVQALLDDEAQAESYFARDNPQGEAETIRLAFDTPERDVPGEQEGQRMGRYKLLQRIGEGGFGRVWLAEQTEPVTRRVALKIIKQGMDTREVIARFEAERQALAMMDHPNIAKILDAGATDTGRPFFVMELVKGLPVTEFCNERMLDIGQRLQLFAEICAAVHHAHQKGIIHRDIKPSNVLVTLHGDRPVPMVIDFGIAKATQARLTARTLFTRFDQFIGTPVYMSPEQAALSGLDIDTRSDIYSLGMLLYELLTGKPPFDARSLYDAGFDEMRRIILEEEPPRPSVQLASTVGAAAALLASSHQAEPFRLSRFVRGDLDWIVMKAISKDREQRYQSASDFVEDIRRFLADEPVTATPPSTTYRLRKIWRRNRMGITLALATGIVLVVATVVSVWQAKLSRDSAAESLKARQEAITKGAAERAAREESEAVVEFLIGMIESPDPARDGYKVTVAETLGRAVTNLNANLSGRPALRAHLQATLGLTYQALGLNREAIALLEQALDYFRSARGVDLRVMRTTMSHLADCYITADRYEEGRKLFEELFELTQREFGLEHHETVSAMARLGDSCRLVGRIDDAVTLQEEALRISRRTRGDDHAQTIDVMNNLSNLYFNVNRNEEALKLLEEALRLSRKVNGSNAPSTLWAMSTLGITYFQAGRRADGIGLIEAGLAFSRQVLGPEHPDTIFRLGLLAKVYFDTNRRDDALRLREEAFPLARKVHGLVHHITRDAMSHLAESYLAAGRAVDALPLLTETFSATHGPGAYPGMQLAALQLWFGEKVSYERTRRQILELNAETDQPAEYERTAKVACLQPIPEVAMQEVALTLARRAVELGQANVELPWFQMALGMAEYRAGKHGAANRTLATAEQAKPPTFKPELVRCTAGFYRAMSLFHLGNARESRQVFEVTAANMRPLPVDDRNPLADQVGHDEMILWLAYKEAKELLMDSKRIQP